MAKSSIETRLLKNAARLAAPAVLLAVFGCTPTTTTATPASSTRPVRADDMSAEEHRAEAQRQEDTARSYQGRANPAYPGEVAAPYADRVSGRQDVAVETSSGLRVTRARGYTRHATQHRKAAELLETFEAAECGMSPGLERAVCPLLVEVSRIEEVRMGVRLHLVEGSDTEQVVNHMRCHHAFGRTRGFEDMDACPLYLKHIRIREVDADVVELVGDRASTAKEIQRRARDHVAPRSEGAVKEAP